MSFGVPIYTFGDNEHTNLNANGVYRGYASLQGEVIALWEGLFNQVDASLARTLLHEIIHAALDQSYPQFAQNKKCEPASSLHQGDHIWRTLRAAQRAFGSSGVDGAKRQEYAQTATNENTDCEKAEAAGACNACGSDVAKPPIPPCPGPCS